MDPAEWMPLQKPLLLPNILNEVCLSCDHPMEYDSVYDGLLQRRPNLLTRDLRTEDGDGNGDENVA